MPRANFSAPHPDTLIATYPAPELRLYAALAKSPLFATVRIIGPAIPNSRAHSHWLGWCIADQRWARGVILTLIPAPILQWAEYHVAETYPSVEEATGMSPSEVAALAAEYAGRRRRKA